eukprot:52232_1
MVYNILSCSIATFFILSIHVCLTDNIIEVYSISTTATFQSTTSSSGTFAQSIIPAQKIAFDEINNRSDILPNITLKLNETEDCGNNKLCALGNSISIVQQSSSTCYSNTNNNPNTSVSPIVLGCPWSAFSEITAPVFAKFNYIQISTSSSATSLSGVPSFYRMMPNVEIIGKAWIPLCKHFGWNKIGIVYIDDTYGENLKDQIENECQIVNISYKSHPFSYSTNDSETDAKSMKDTAVFIKDNKLYVTIVVSSSGDLQYVMSSFKRNEILQYPYYFMFRSTPNENFTNLPGFMTIMPFYPSRLSKTEYTNFNVYDNNISIYNTANDKFTQIKVAWKELFNTQPSIVYNRSEVHDYAPWAYDAAITLGYTLHYLVENNFDLFNINFNNMSVVNAMKDYLTNKLRFIGASGLVELNDAGDRMHGYYLYGYINHNFEFVPFGAYTDNDNDTINVTIAAEIVEFPDYFNGKKPRSIAELKITPISVKYEWNIAVNILCIIFVIFTILCMILILKEREHPTIKKSSYKLTILICCGAVLGFVHLMLQNTGNFGCISTKYGRGIVITLLFVPVFARFYRLHRIMKMKRVNFDVIRKFEKNFIRTGIGTMIAVDIILFIVVTLIHRTHNNILSLEFVFDIEKPSTDLLLITQNKFEFCVEKNVKIATIFGVILFVYKCTQFAFGLYFAFTIFRNKWTYVTKNNDEMVMVLVSVLLSVVILFIVITYLFVASNKENIQLTYCLYSLLIMFIILIIMIGNVLPRLYFRYKTNKTEIYQKRSPEEIMIQAHIHTITSTTLTTITSQSTDQTITTDTLEEHKDSNEHDMGMSIIDEEQKNDSD